MPPYKFLWFPQAQCRAGGLTMMLNEARAHHFRTSFITVAPADFAFLSQRANVVHQDVGQP